jgi:integrase
MARFDPYNHEKKWKDWKLRVKSGIPDISKANSKVILQYLDDMEIGRNIAKGTVKGGRSYVRLNTLRDRMPFFARKFYQIYRLVDITEISENQVLKFFNDMRRGYIKREDGREYMSVETYAKIFRAFWHWWIKYNDKKGIKINNIVEDVNVKSEKPKWVYMTENQVNQLAKEATDYYRTSIMFLYDSGIRSPTELMNIRVSDIIESGNSMFLDIRQEIAKKGSHGRKITLKLCPDLIRRHIKNNHLSDNDFLFTKSPQTMNKYLKRLAKRVLGDKRSLAGKKYSELTMYDFRHCSCCFWINIYPKERKLMYRFGWKKSDKIYYYSELLGLHDDISDEDMLTEFTKAQLEKDVVKLQKEKESQGKRIKRMEEQMLKMQKLTSTILEKTYVLGIDR